MPPPALLYRRPNEPGRIEIAFDGAVLPIRIRRHRQARRYTLRIQAPTREVVLTIPPRGTLKEARAFAEKHCAWIAVRLGRLPQAAPFADGVLLPLRGELHRITERQGARGTVWTESDGTGRQLLCVAGQTRHLNRRLADFLQREARRDLEAASRRFAGHLGLSVRRVTVRDQSSRWGSCSTTGVLSFSWRLILAPGYVLEYLAAHEVAHLIEMNHSVRFWRVVNRLVPDHERAKAWLDAHGADLHRYGLAEPASSPA
jgi:predicted metal-dependent hydrolase